MGTYNSFVLGLFLGVIGFAVVVAYPKFLKRPNRIIPAGASLRRTAESQALAAAFATLYERFSDGVFTHFVTPEDRMLVYAIVRQSLRSNRDRLGEIYLGRVPFEIGEAEIADKIVKQAEELFLQI